MFRNCAFEYRVQRDINILQETHPSLKVAHYVQNVTMNNIIKENWNFLPTDKESVSGNKIQIISILIQAEATRRINNNYITMRSSITQEKLRLLTVGNMIFYQYFQL